MIDYLYYIPIPSNNAPNIPCKVEPAPGGAMRYAYEVIYVEHRNKVLEILFQLIAMNKLNITVDQYTPNVKPFNNSIGNVSQGLVSRE